jgi:recombination protein RecT
MSQSLTVVQDENLKTVAGYLKQRLGKLTEVLPRSVSIDIVRLINVLMASCSRNNKLAQSTPQSIYACFHLATTLGLEPNTPLGQFYLVPRKNGFLSKKAGRDVIEATPIIGYKGMVELARRSTGIDYVDASVVYQGEPFTAERGTDGFIKHPYVWEIDRTNIKNALGAYATITPRNSKPLFEILDASEIDERRKRSAARDDGPWVTDPRQMWKKTAMRALCMGGRIPLSAEMAMAIDAESRLEMPEMAERAISEILEVEDVGDEGETTGTAQPEMDRLKNEMRASAPAAKAPPIDVKPTVVQPSVDPRPPADMKTVMQESRAMHAENGLGRPAVKNYPAETPPATTPKPPEFLVNYNQGQKLLAKARQIGAVVAVEAQALDRELANAYSNADKRLMDTTLSRLRSAIDEHEAFEKELASQQQDGEDGDDLANAALTDMPMAKAPEQAPDPIMEPMRAMNNAIEEARASGRFTTEELQGWRRRMLEHSAVSNVKSLTDDAAAIRRTIEVRSEKAKPAVSADAAAAPKADKAAEVEGAASAIQALLLSLGRAKKGRIVQELARPDLWEPAMKLLNERGVLGHEGEKNGREYFIKGQTPKATPGPAVFLTDVYDQTKAKIAAAAGDWLSKRQAAALQQRLDDAMQDGDEEKFSSVQQELRKIEESL